jgi:hypothetical protein
MPKCHDGPSQDLDDHLSSCPETRFTAVHLFSRYLHRIGMFEPRPTRRRTESAMESQRIQEEVIWETAVACLALSVKVYTVLT